MTAALVVLVVVVVFGALASAFGFAHLVALSGVVALLWVYVIINADGGVEW